MIGPSAPKGAPVPIAAEVATGLAIAARPEMRLWWRSTESIASGIPWPRTIGSRLAIRLTSTPPATAIGISVQPGWTLAS